MSSETLPTRSSVNHSRGQQTGGVPRQEEVNAGGSHSEFLRQTNISHASSPLHSFLILPVAPLNRMYFEVTVNCTTERRHEVALADALEDSIVLQAVLDRPFQLRKTEVHPQFMQLVLESREHVGSGNIDVRYRLGRYYGPIGFRGRGGPGLWHTVL